MKDPTGFKVMQVRLFSMDCVPLDLLGSAGIQALREAFLFESVDRSQPGVVVFSRGSVRFVDAQSPPTNIESLEVGPRRIGLVVEGDSNDADSVYTALASWFSKQRPFSPEPLVLSEETSCVCTLDIEYAQVFSAAFRDFIDHSVEPMLSHPAAAAKFERFGVTLTVSFPVVEPSIRQQGVTFAEKSVYLEPRIQTPLSKHRFFTRSPIRSDKHLELLSTLEKFVLGGSARE